MRKLELVPDLPPAPRPEIVVLTGTFVHKTYSELPYRFIARDKESSIPTSKRVFDLGRAGLGPLDESLAALRERMKEFTQNETDGTPPIIVGHSQGALHAVRLATEGYGSAAISVAGPQNGVESWLGRSVGRVSPGIKDMIHDSEFMQEHAGIIENIPPELYVDNIAASSDILVSRQAQFGGAISEHSRSFVDLRKIYGSKTLDIIQNHAPDALPMQNPFFSSDHLSVIWSPAVRKRVLAAQRTSTTAPTHEAA